MSSIHEQINASLTAQCDKGIEGAVEVVPDQQRLGTIRELAVGIAEKIEMRLHSSATSAIHVLPPIR